MAYSALVSNINMSSRSRTVSKRPPALCIVATRALKLTPIQTRGLWRHTYHRGGSKNSDERRRSERYQHPTASRLRDQASRHRRRSQISSDSHRGWWNLGWEWGRPKSNFPSSRNHGNDFWEAQRTRTLQRIEQIKKEIEADPYVALFGQRLEPFSLSDKHGGIFSSMFQSFFGHGRKPETDIKSTDTTARVTTTHRPSTPQAGDKQAPVSPRKEGTPREILVNKAKEDYEFDPISGRMVPKMIHAFDEVERGKPAGISSSADLPNTNDGNHVNGAGFHSPLHCSKSQSRAGGFMDSGTFEDVAQPKRCEESCPREALQGQGTLPSENTNNHEASGRPSEIVVDELANLHHESLSSAKAILDSQSETSHEQNQLQGRTLNQKESLPGVSKDIKQEPSIPSNISTETLGSSSLTTRDLKQQETWVTQAEKEEDLDLLRASDIRASYELRNQSRETDAQIQKKRRDLEMAFELYQDPVKDLDAQSIREKHNLQGSLSSKTMSKPSVSSMQMDMKSQNTPDTPVPRTHSIPQKTKPESNTDPDQRSQETQAHRIHPWSAATYRVLVYDPSTMQVTEAGTSSSIPSTDKSLSPADVLSRLNHPAKFLPYLAKMDDDGYEIVSGNGDVIVFRQAASSYSDRSPSSGGLTGQLASIESRHEGNSGGEPTSSGLPPILPVAGKAPGATVHPRASSRVHAALRRILISGVATAATCYAVGVVVEYFRTGGQDGLGIDGFTEFESERRRRDRE